MSINMCDIPTDKVRIGIIPPWEDVPIYLHNLPHEGVCELRSDWPEIEDPFTLRVREIAGEGSVFGWLARLGVEVYIVNVKGPHPDMRAYISPNDFVRAERAVDEELRARSA